MLQVQHLCTLLGYGADAVCPYLGVATLFALQQDGRVPASMTHADIENKYIKVRFLMIRFSHLTTNFLTQLWFQSMTIPTVAPSDLLIKTNYTCIRADFHHDYHL